MSSKNLRIHWEIPLLVADLGPPGLISTPDPILQAERERATTAGGKFLMLHEMDSHVGLWVWRFTGAYVFQSSLGEKRRPTGDLAP